MSVSRCLDNTLPNLGVVIKFRKVASPELQPLDGLMAEPASQRIAWGYLLKAIHQARGALSLTLVARVDPLEIGIHRPSLAVRKLA